MHQDHGPRQTGRTTKMLLAAASAISNGEHVLIVAQNNQISSFIQTRLQAIFNGCLLCSNGMMILPGGAGFARFVTPSTLQSLQGLRFDKYFSDPGELEAHELQVILPLLKGPINEHPARRVLSSR